MTAFEKSEDSMNQPRLNNADVDLAAQIDMSKFNLLHVYPREAETLPSFGLNGVKGAVLQPEDKGLTCPSGERDTTVPPADGGKTSVGKILSKWLNCTTNNGTDTTEPPADKAKPHQPGDTLTKESIEPKISKVWQDAAAKLGMGEKPLGPVLNELGRQIGNGDLDAKKLQELIKDISVSPDQMPKFKALLAEFNAKMKSEHGLNVDFDFFRPETNNDILLPYSVKSLTVTAADGNRAIETQLRTNAEGNTSARIRINPDDLAPTTFAIAPDQAMRRLGAFARNHAERKRVGERDEMPLPNAVKRDDGRTAIYDYLDLYKNRRK